MASSQWVETSFYTVFLGHLASLTVRTDGGNNDGMAGTGRTFSNNPRSDTGYSSALARRLMVFFTSLRVVASGGLQRCCYGRRGRRRIWGSNPGDSGSQGRYIWRLQAAHDLQLTFPENTELAPYNVILQWAGAAATFGDLARCRASSEYSRAGARTVRTGRTTVL